MTKNNKNNKNNTYNTLSHWHKFRLKLMFEGIFVGIFAGLLVVFYRVSLEKAENMRTDFINLDIDKGLLIPLWFLILFVLAYIVGRLLKNEPLISGSGIPQVKAQLLGKLEVNWLAIIIKKTIGGIISIGAGLSLGRAAPSVQLGAAAGQGFSRIFKRMKIEEKYLITSGASAGLAATFNAPLAGVMFSLEEMHKNFSPLILLSALSASLSADFISAHFFGLRPVFIFNEVGTIPLNNYGYIVVLGIVVGLLGVLYNYSLIKTQDLYAKLKWIPVQFRQVIPFMIAGVLAFTLPQVLGGGHGIMDNLIEGSFTMKMILLVLVGKFIFSMISYGSGAPGGIFFPLLILGALTGALYGNILVYFFNFSAEYINSFIILAMAGYFTAIIRAPITGSILITEMTGSFSHLLSLTVISLVAYVVADLLRSIPIYESLLERLLKSNKTYETGSDSKTKTILEIPISLYSEIDGKKIKDLKFPEDCLLVAIRRGEKEIIPRGDTRIYSGDYLNVLVNEDKAAIVNEELSAMGQKKL